MRTLLMAAAAAVAAAAPAADKVTTLPGWGTPITDTYSGMLSIPGGKSLHYLFYASQSGNANDPLILWFNGGPGCSSLEGAFQESGPYWTTDGGKTLQPNNYTWNGFAHNLFLEAPACVGFSTASSPSGCTHNDTGTAADNLAALKEWRTLFPEYSTQDFYIAGESYAGIYVPSLAYDIVQDNKAGGDIPLKGIFVGNGCLGNSVGICGGAAQGDYFSVAQLHGHGFVSDKAWASVTAACTDLNKPTQACVNALNDAGNEAGSNFDIYDIYAGAWGVCPYGPLAGKAPRPNRKVHARFPVAPGSVAEKLLAASAAGNGCTDDSDLEAYLNRADVQAALHVTAPAGGWSVCANINYTPDIVDERKTIYPGLLAAGLKVVIYNGEADACVPITDNQWWTSSMNYPIKAGWAPWSASDGSLGGYIVKYSPPSGSFTFATVRMAGHMVPQTQPLYARDLIQNVLLKAE